MTDTSKNVELVQVLCDIGAKLGYEIEHWGESEGIYHTRFRAGPVAINVGVTADLAALIYVYVRTTSWELSGERTDANELISIMLAVSLRIAAGGWSSLLRDVPHPALGMPETEVYARLITIDQPNESRFTLDESGIRSFYMFLRAVWLFVATLRWYFDWEKIESLTGEFEDWSYNEARPWAEQIASALNEECDDNVQFCSRTNPSWLHFRSIKSHVTVYRAPTLSEHISKVLSFMRPWEQVSGINGELLVSETTCNIIPRSALRRIRSLQGHLHKSATNNNTVVVPLENYCVAFQPPFIFVLASDCSRKRYNAEVARIKQRHDRERTILFKPLSFVWNIHIDDEVFERLTLELLNREHGVKWARKVSASNERDAGRDILCEWLLEAPPHTTIHEGQSPFGLRRIIVQCKAFSGSVGKSKVQDIRDTVEGHNAHGYLLVVSSGLTSGLSDHLYSLRTAGTLWVDWWTRQELEDRLKKPSNADILIRYGGIVQASPQ